MVKFGKKFFFNNTYVKKDKTITIVIIITVILLILTTIFITSKFIEKNTIEPQKKIELYENISIELFESLPDKLTYFSHLENVNVNDIKITYPDNMSKENDFTKCSEESRTTIENIQKGQEYNGNIDELISCLNYKITKAGSYPVTIQIGKDEYRSELKVVDSEAPILVVKDFEIFTDENYSENDFVESCQDNSNEECSIEFLNTSIVNYSTYKDPGEYTIKIKAIDSSGNESEAKTANLKIKEIIYHTVTFNTDGGSNIESQKIRDGYTVSSPNSPTKSNYSFEGWYLNNTEYDFSKKVTQDITLKAKWKKISQPNPGGGGGGNTGGGGSKPSACVPYNEALDMPSIYIYQIKGGSAKDCMEKSSSPYSSAAQSISETYKSAILSDFKKNVLYFDEKNQCSTNTHRSTKPVVYNNYVVGFNITYEISATCPSTVYSSRISEVYELQCSSTSSCKFYLR